jgi:putative ABC transport system ATP-binding protein
VQASVRHAIQNSPIFFKVSMSLPDSSSRPVLSAANVTKTVDNGGVPLTILHAVSFSVERGETLAIVGASGSGKSTLLGLLAGLDSPSSGQLTFDGVELATLDEDGRAQLRARSLGFVFQSFQLLPSLTALENVSLPLELAGHPDPMNVAMSWLERVGLGERLKHRPKFLSGGEQQRVALARAFAPNPALIMADEPTGNLDAETGKEIIELIFRLNAEYRTTLVLVTHDDALASRCNRVLRMHQGSLSADR